MPYIQKYYLKGFVKNDEIHVWQNKLFDTYITGTYSIDTEQASVIPDNNPLFTG